MSAGEYEIRNCRGLEELEACVQLQKEVWQIPDLDLMPLRIFVVAQKVGGQAIGCFHGEKLAGFLLALPGRRGGHSYLHSQMLAVRPEHRDRGIGRRLKLAQREAALAEGIELIEWTFDPLEIKNAFLNIARLGAIARRYTTNQYGPSASPLQGGLPTDRLVAEWWLGSRRVQKALAGEKIDVHAQETIEVPVEIYAWKAMPAERAKALAVQSRNRERFLQAFERGQAVVGYERDAAGNGRFLLGDWDEKWSY